MNIQYRIEKIETSQFAIFPEALTVDGEIKITSGFNFATSNDTSHIRCITTIRYEQNDKLILILELACHYALSPEGIEQIKIAGKVDVEFLRYMATIAVGTARGVIHSRTQSTQLNGFVLPPINLIPIIKEDMQLLK